jgi:hypothetical protein
MTKIAGVGGVSDPEQDLDMRRPGFGSVDPDLEKKKITNGKEKMKISWFEVPDGLF